MLAGFPLRTAHRLRRLRHISTSSSSRRAMPRVRSPFFYCHVQRRACRAFTTLSRSFCSSPPHTARNIPSGVLW